MFKRSCRRMKCDEGSDAWNNLRISHIHVFLKNLRQHVPRKKNIEFAKVRRKKKKFGEDDVFQMKEFRTTLIYIYTHAATLCTVIFVDTLNKHTRWCYVMLTRYGAVPADVLLTCSDHYFQCFVFRKSLSRTSSVFQCSCSCILPWAIGIIFPHNLHWPIDGLWWQAITFGWWLMDVIASAV